MPMISRIYYIMGEKINAVDEAKASEKI